MTKDPVASTTALLTHYSFELDGHTIDQVVQDWLAEYPPKWVIAAVVEAIFQGRYKAASVDNILLTWSLSGRPQPHFDSEFADLVCSKIFKGIPKVPSTIAVDSTQQTSATLFDVSLKTSHIEPQPGSFSTRTKSLLPKGENQGISKWLKLVTKLD